MRRLYLSESPRHVDDEQAPHQTAIVTLIKHSAHLPHEPQRVLPEVLRREAADINYADVAAH